MTEVHSIVVPEQPQKAAAGTKRVAPNKSLPADRRRETAMTISMKGIIVKTYNSIDPSMFDQVLKVFINGRS